MLCLSGFELYSRWVPLPTEHKADETKDNKNGTSLFAELKPLYANSG